LSSIGVLGATSGSGSFDALSQPSPHDFYARTKLEGERAAAAAAAGTELCVVRAPLVFGPEAPGNFGRLIASIRKGWPLPLGAIRNRRSLVSVWNLCDLLIACLTRPGAPGAPLLVADAPAVSTPELVRLCAELLGVTARLWPVPVGVLRLAAAAAGREADFMRLCGSLTVDDRDTRRRLEWAPPLDLRAGLRQSLRPGS
jgi:nucleoside-diphosphate-sugar epimerase